MMVPSYMPSIQKLSFAEICHKLLTPSCTRDSMALRKIGFVGLGNMGYGMARNVARTALVSVSPPNNWASMASS